MRALSQRQRQFVYALLETGTNDHTRAAAMAGYSTTSRNSLRVYAHFLAHNPKVQAALHEESVKRLGAAKVMAVSELVKIAETTNDERVKLKALGMIMNRTGLHEKTEHTVKVESDENSKGVLERIAFLAGALGVDVSKLVGSATPQKQIAYLDVEAIPVEEDPPDEVVSEHVNIEDIL